MHSRCAASIANSTDSGTQMSKLRFWSCPPLHIRWSCTPEHPRFRLTKRMLTDQEGNEGLHIDRKGSQLRCREVTARLKNERELLFRCFFNSVSQEVMMPFLRSATFAALLQRACGSPCGYADCTRFASTSALESPDHA